MEITTSVEKENSIIFLKGDLDASSSIAFDNAIRSVLELQPKYIWVDCSQLSYISSAGLGVIISHLQDLRSRQVPLVLLSLNERLENVFHVLGLDILVPILPDRSSAVHYCEAWSKVAAFA